MGLPGHRRTSSDKRRRAAHFALNKAQTTTCAACGKPCRPHHACLSCGQYRGRAELSMERATARLVKKAGKGAKVRTKEEKPEEEKETTKETPAA